MLGVIGNRFSIGKETYTPFSAELHYFRIEKRYWSICFERIRKAGFRIISTAVPWNIHQDNTKHVDFAGFDDPRKDLIVFLELAREFGFKVILRPGPMVFGQLPYAGLPQALFTDIKLYARDSSGAEIKLPDQNGVKGGYLPSYLHRNFQFHLRNYFKAFIETTKNYVHPRGPVFMVELDYETSFGHLLNPGSADYNPDVLAEFFPEFLCNRYEDIKKLNSAYKEKNKDFESVEPPRKFDGLELNDYPKVLDWFRFREYVLNEYLSILEDVFTSFTVEPLLFRSLYFRPGDILPAFDLVPDDRSPFLGTNIFPEGSYFDLTNKARFLKAEYGFAFAASFSSGAAASDPERDEAIAPINPNVRRFYIAAGLAAGLKGLNHYMFVDRDHWYGAPLRQDGTVASTYDVVKNFNIGIETVDFDEITSEPKVAILANRLYYWMREAKGKRDFQYFERLLNETTTGFCRDLARLRLEYSIRENRDYNNMNQFETVFVPSGEVMAEKDQEAIIELAKAGTTIIMCGLMPKYNEHFKDCQVLAKHFRIKTTVGHQVVTVSHKAGAFTGSFAGYAYGSIRSTDESKVRILATADSKTVGVCSTRFKGSLYFFSFDIASGGDHNKLAYIESILGVTGHKSYLYCSDPSINLAFHMGGKKGLLYVVAPPPGQLSDGLEAACKEVIIQADLRQAGFAAAKIKLTNILEDAEEVKPIRITAKELRSGLVLPVQFPDGMIFRVEKG
ncbi:MAG: beta-galactosidase [candidate division Zixibacteria bacterium]|nr:beta-galactosidase [candidate division Zixibacteria bacterium]